MMPTYARASVAGLLSWRSPSTILRAIRTVVVDSVERCAARAWTHVREELREVIAPFLAYGYAAPPPLVESLARWVVTAIFRGAPRTVFGRYPAAISAAHRAAVGGDCFGVLAVDSAPATLGVAGSDFGGWAYSGVAADAKAFPPNLLRFSVGWLFGSTENEPVAKAFPGYFNDSVWHTSRITRCR